MAHQQRQTEAVWRERLGRFHDSGLTAKAFCEREGVSYSNFHAWKRRLGLGRMPSPSRTSATLSGNEPLFVPVSVTPPSSAAEVRIVLPGGAVVHVPLEADERVLALAIQAAARTGREDSAC